MEPAKIRGFSPWDMDSCASAPKLGSNLTTQAVLKLLPEVRVAYNDGYDARALRELLGLFEANKGRIEKAWNEFFG